MNSTERVRLLKVRRKQLESELAAAQARIEGMKGEFGTQKELISDLHQQVYEVGQRLKYEEKRPLVSDHAIVRYFERIVGIDMDEVRGKILCEGTAAAVDRLGDGRYPVVGGGTAVVRNKVVVTVVP